MADDITDHGRALIATFPEHRITRVPRGVSGEPVTYYYTGRGECDCLRGTVSVKDRVRAQHRIIARQRRFAAALRRGG